MVQSRTEAAAGLPFVVADNGVRLAVRLTPRAARNGLDGVVRGADGRFALHLRVAAPPVEGAANEALIAYLADELKLRKSEIRIVSGDRARLKIVDLSGDAADIAARLARWIGASRDAM